jgi:hypothetical protein
MVGYIVYTNTRSRAICDMYCNRRTWETMDMGGCNPPKIIVYYRYCTL